MRCRPASPAATPRTDAEHDRNVIALWNKIAVDELAKLDAEMLEAETIPADFDRQRDMKHKANTICAFADAITKQERAK